MKRRLLVPAAVLACALSGGAAYAVSTGDGAAGSTATAAAGDVVPRAAYQPAARPVAATPEQLGLPATLTAPTAGVTTVEGAFSDRVRWDSLRLEDGALLGDLVVTSDVSEIISATVTVAFYDAAGARLGVQEQDFAEYDGAHEAHAGEGYTAKVEGEPQPLAVPAPVGATSALVSLTDLVNE